MSLVAVTVLEILAALALGFVIGRIWQIRRDEFGIVRFRRSRAFRALITQSARHRLIRQG